ncbi:MAG: ROK family protein [Clostridia bacterium]|nr:ROK family protein [Clostridia bacterium]
MKIGIDLGGTTVGIGVVDENYKIVAETEMRTADCKTPDELASIVLEGTRKLIESNHIDQKDITFIGMGCPGEIDTEKGIAVAADNLPIEKSPFAKLLTETFGAPARLDNDANCAAWGEHMAGVSKGYKNIVTVTLGTGIGGGIIVDGKLLHGKENHAGEIGHMVIDIHGKRCGCGRIGCWETMASTRALIKEVEHQARYAPNSRLGKLIAANGGHANGKTLFIAMSEEDNMARSIFNDWIRALEVGMWNVINIFRPDMIVISGGISNEGETLLAPLRNAVGKCSTLIRAGRLGGNAGLIGAAALDEMVI